MHRNYELASVRTRGFDAPARVDVRVKLIVAVAAILAVVAAGRCWLPLFALAGALATLCVRGIGPRYVLDRLAGPAALAAMAGMLRVFLTGHTPLAAFHVWGWQLTATREGLHEGLLLGAHVLASVSIVILLCACTSAHEIFAALRWLRMPRTWVEIAVLMYRYTFTLFTQAAAVLAAQRVRLGYANYRRSLHSAGGLSGIVTLQAIDQAERTHEAMVARGYQGSLHLPSLPRLGWRQWLALIVALAAIVALFLVAERWPR
jgi:cobalt/nickel transport system permease protein